MKILITGAAGAIGKVLAQGLQDRHELRGFDCQPMPEIADAIVGDIVDFDQVKAATEGMEAVIHLVNVPGGQWEYSLQSMTGTYNAFEAAHQCGVRRIAYASRAGILPQSFYPRSIQRTAQMLPKPDSYYTISKVFGESIGYMYSARFDMEAVSVRIGNFNADRDQPEHPHHLSHGDCVHLFEQAITHPGVKYEVVFGVSDSDWPLYDLDHGREVIGYHPQDRSHVPEEERK
ncbi:MAG: NAD(P)-dependent oxidoreductase [Candidatus Latescibacterota bacterium]|nr:NAD(P)-dependent oxidoreductase [Candidatus Latescibacterota bacterium]